MREGIVEFLNSTGFLNISLGQAIMLTVSCFLLYLGIRRKYEPLLLVPIAFGILLANYIHRLQWSHSDRLIQIQHFSVFHRRKHSMLNQKLKSSPKKHFW